MIWSLFTCFFSINSFLIFFELFIFNEFASLKICIMFFSSTFLSCQQMMHLISLNVEDCVVVVPNSLFTWTSLSLCSSRWTSYILSDTFDWFQKLILYLDSVWFDYIYKKIVFDGYPSNNSVLSHVMLSQNIVILEASFHVGLSMTHSENHF